MSTPVKRYEADRDGDPFEYVHGKFVLYEDYAALMQEIDVLRKLTPEQWEFAEYVLTADNAHTEWSVLAQLRARLL